MTNRTIDNWKMSKTTLVKLVAAITNREFNNLCLNTTILNIDLLFSQFVPLTGYTHKTQRFSGPKVRSTMRMSVRTLGIYFSPTWTTIVCCCGLHFCCGIVELLLSHGFSAVVLLWWKYTFNQSCLAKWIIDVK